jgi:hypothetical protein
MKDISTISQTTWLKHGQSPTGLQAAQVDEACEEPRRGAQDDRSFARNIVIAELHILTTSTTAKA